MRLRTLRQQQLEDEAEQVDVTAHELDGADDTIPTYPTPFKCLSHSPLDRHFTSLTTPSPLHASQLSLVAPSLPTSLDSLQERLYSNAQLVRWALSNY